MLKKTLQNMQRIAQSNQNNELRIRLRISIGSKDRREKNNFVTVVMNKLETKVLATHVPTILVFNVHSKLFEQQKNGCQRFNSKAFLLFNACVQLIPLKILAILLINTVCVVVTL